MRATRSLVLGVAVCAAALPAAASTATARPAGDGPGPGYRLALDRQVTTCAGKALHPTRNGNELSGHGGQVCYGAISHQSILVCLGTGDGHYLKCKTKSRSGPGPLNASPTKSCTRANRDRRYRSYLMGSATAVTGQTLTGYDFSAVNRVRLRCG